MTARVVDYTPLLTAPTPQDVAAYRAQAKASGAAWARVNATQVILAVVAGLIGAFIVLPVIGGVVTSIVEGFRSGSPVGSVFLGFFALVLILLIALVAHTVISGRGRWAAWVRMERFAAANGLTFSPSDANPSYPGAIFALGSDRRAEEHFRTTDGRFLDFGNYRYTTGSGRNRTTRRWGFLALKLDRRLPHMVLDARANNGLFGGTNLPAFFDKDQVLSLEGDFDRYFTLYCPKEYERDALYVFTPDLMALLIDEAAPFDVEIVDDWMFVYSPRGFVMEDTRLLGRLLRIIDLVGNKALRRTDRYRDEKATVEFPANVVAPPGQRLRRRFPTGLVIALVLVIAMPLLVAFAGTMVAILTALGSGG